MKVSHLFIILSSVFYLAGCGDYDNDELPDLKLTKEQLSQLITVSQMNFMCAAVNRYSNDIGAPIEGDSYLSNGRTALILVFNFVAKHNPDKKYDQLRNDMDSVIEQYRVKAFKAVIQDLNHYQDLQAFYQSVLSGQYIIAAFKTNLRDCGDVSAATRRVMDGYLLN